MMATSRLFIDTNVFMYAVGTDHPMKEPCIRVLRRVAETRIAAIINTEVIQEILHRYSSLRQIHRGIIVAREARQSATVVLPVTEGDALLAMEILDAHPDLPTRDAFHAATVINNKIETIISVDPHFDSIPQVRRIPPEQVS
jgi:hypothetical protein